MMFVLKIRIVTPPVEDEEIPSFDEIFWAEEEVDVINTGNYV